MINLTQHNATPDQLQAGVVDLPAETQHVVRSILTFEEPPTAEEMYYRAEELANIVTTVGEGPCDVMVRGAPFFASALERALARANHTVHYAFSKRESADQPQPDGSVKKVAVFRHTGFVRSCVSSEHEAEYLATKD